MIKKFIINGLLFLIPLAIMPAIIAVGYQLNHPSVLNPSDLSKNILILGDSHTECGINDSILSNSLNYSESSEPYMFCYAKLQMISNGEAPIDTLLLSVNPRSLSARTAIPGVNKFNATLCLLDLHTLSDFLDEMHLYMFGRLLRPFWKKPILEGGYSRLIHCKLAQDIELNKNKERNSCITYPLQLSYLKKIVQLCKEKNIQLYFVNVPMYQAEKYFNMDNFYQCIKTDFKEVKFLDYGNMVLSDSCYADTGHLNYKGAEVFSTLLEQNFHKKRKYSEENKIIDR